MAGRFKTREAQRAVVLYNMESGMEEWRKRHIECWKYSWLLLQIGDAIKKEDTGQGGIGPNERLTMCVYRLTCGDDLYSIGELFGHAECTVCTIVTEVWSNYRWTLGDISEKLFSRQSKHLWDKWLSWMKNGNSLLDGSHIFGYPLSMKVCNRDQGSIGQRKNIKIEVALLNISQKLVKMVMLHI